MSAKSCSDVLKAVISCGISSSSAYPPEKIESLLLGDKNGYWRDTNVEHDLKTECSTDELCQRARTVIQTLQKRSDNASRHATAKGDSVSGNADGLCSAFATLSQKCEAWVNQALANGNGALPSVLSERSDDPNWSPATALQDLVLGVFRSNKSETTDSMVVANTLLELLGFEAFDFVTEVCTLHSKIIQSDAKRNSSNAEKQASSRKREQMHQRRRAHKAAQKGLREDDPSSLPHVYTTKAIGPVNSFGIKRTVLQTGASGMTLPSGTVHVNENDYEEFRLPAHIPDPFQLELLPPKLQPSRALPPWAVPAFRGYKSFNHVQSLVLPCAFKTNENLLVCAPTGAGKTEVAMLCILRVLYTLIANSSNLGPDFNVETATASEAASLIAHGAVNYKVVYLAPMKALASEIVGKFLKRLGYLKVKVRELTGDTQLSRREIEESHILVATPEKWDIITRKSGYSDSNGSGADLVRQCVKLLLVDEIHFLHEERGPVLEAIVARTLRLVETTQSMIRLVGLSATLPNYPDIAEFLRVNPNRGLFFFDAGFRPVPLDQNFIGIKKYKAGSPLYRAALDKTCFRLVTSILEEDPMHQIMVFVHSRKETYRAAMALREVALEEGKIDEFTGILQQSANAEFSNTRALTMTTNADLKKLLSYNLGMHNAGMQRSDRDLVERLFLEGHIRVLFCTATLAWGVNLPAHAVIIRGTDIFDQEKGRVVDIGVLDILQIFGRAGRPQFEPKGVGYLITSHAKLSHFVTTVTNALPVESQFEKFIADNLNAEIVLDTVSSIDDAVRWLGCSYMFVRMRKNPKHYGIESHDREPGLSNTRRRLVEQAARRLVKSKMIKYDEASGQLFATQVGRIAAEFYVDTETVDLFLSRLNESLKEADVLDVLCESSEFSNITVREDEGDELAILYSYGGHCQIKNAKKDPITGQILIGDTPAKVNVLLQAYISNCSVETASLIAETAQIAQNAARILRSLLHMALHFSYVSTAITVLNLCKSVELRMWRFQHPLTQLMYFLPHGVTKRHIIEKLGSAQLTVESLREMPANEICKHINASNSAGGSSDVGQAIKRCANLFPLLKVQTRVAPLTRSIFELWISITCDFEWNDAAHAVRHQSSGFNRKNSSLSTMRPKGALRWWIWLEDDKRIYYVDQFTVRRLQHPGPISFSFKIALGKDGTKGKSLASAFSGKPVLHWASDAWIGADSSVPVIMKNVRLPDPETPFTELLDLCPLPISALQIKELEEYFEPKFKFFNSIQTQLFYPVYRTKCNMLIGAPTGSGKTSLAELAIFSTLFNDPEAKAVYIAPTETLVRERYEDWRINMKSLCINIEELTGNRSKDNTAIRKASLIVSTPEKWELLSRDRTSADYEQQVQLMVLDEVHLLHSESGAVLELLISRLRYIMSSSQTPVRLIGLCTSLANASEMADWLGVPSQGLYNFRPTLRPVPIQIHFDGFPGAHYIPRMATMNLPCYRAILRYAVDKPVLVFVSSRRQTKFTAQDLISYCCVDECPRRFRRKAAFQTFEGTGDFDVDLVDSAIESVRDSELAHALNFGIGLHHDGLSEEDRKTVESLYLGGHIQVLVSANTLSLGFKAPAHLVVVKGTEIFDEKRQEYVDMPVTDILQMIGRAGRSGLDDNGVACVFVAEKKRMFYEQFLMAPFPVESHLRFDQCNTLDYGSWTFFARRVKKNPNYYMSSPQKLERDNETQKLHAESNKDSKKEQSIQ